MSRENPPVLRTHLPPLAAARATSAPPAPNHALPSLDNLDRTLPGLHLGAPTFSCSLVSLSLRNPCCGLLTAAPHSTELCLFVPFSAVPLQKKSSWPPTAGKTPHPSEDRMQQPNHRASSGHAYCRGLRRTSRARLTPRLPGRHETDLSAARSTLLRSDPPISERPLSLSRGSLGSSSVMSLTSDGFIFVLRDCAWPTNLHACSSAA